MRVHLIRRETIEEFSRRNPQSRSALREWLTKLKLADWKIPMDILVNFSGADLLGGGSSRVVFNIGGNNYRMICRYLFGDKQVHLYVCWLGTHSGYDEICRSGHQYSICEF